MSPEEFANVEDQERRTWAKENKEKPKPKKVQQSFHTEFKFESLILI